MTDFREAFQTGLEAYEKAESARTEIFQVFDELARQVHEASNGRIRIERKDQLGLQQIATRMIEGLTAAPSLPSNRPPPTYEALIATIPNQRQGAKLCDYELSQQGYPVTLVYNKNQMRVRCHDRESLEVALQSLLKHPSTGGKLRTLLALAREDDAGAAQRPPEPDDDSDDE